MAELRLPLTKREFEVLDAIHYFIKIEGYVPTLNQLSEIFGFSNTSSAQYFVSRLAEKGWLKRTNKQSSIQILAKPVKIKVDER